MSRARVGRRLRGLVLADAGGRCGYCRSSEEITGAPLEIEHILPEARGGPTRRANLWAACRQCNALKGDLVEASDPQTGAGAPLFNPRQQVWAEHFAWVDDGARMTGRTPTGRATVDALFPWSLSTGTTVGLTTDPGWVCRIEGARRAAACGDRAAGVLRASALAQPWLLWR